MKFWNLFVKAGLANGFGKKRKTNTISDVRFIPWSMHGIWILEHRIWLCSLQGYTKITHDKQEMFSITYGQRLVSRSSFVGIFSLKCLLSHSWVFSIWKFHLYEEGVDIVQLVLVNVWIYGGDADKSSSSWFPHSRHHTFQLDSELVCTKENVEVRARLKFSCLQHQL